MKSCKQGFGASPVGDTGRSSEAVFGHAFQSKSAGRSQKRALFLLGQAFLSERRTEVESKRCSSLARPFGRRLDHPSGLSFRYLSRLRSLRNVMCWAEPLLGSRSMRDPGFMNPTGAPEPLGDSGRIVWGIFSTYQRVRVSAPGGCSPQACVRLVSRLEAEYLGTLSWGRKLLCFCRSRCSPIVDEIWSAVYLGVCPR